VKRQRVDHLLVARGLAETRAKAQALVMAGAVFTGERRVEKPGDMLGPDTPIEVRGQLPYVSRGGLKLVAGLDAFGIDPAGMIAIDIGASTGGFTDVLLQRGAARVYAVDVGYGQLHHKLRQDSRVVVLERTNARQLSPSEFPEPVDLVVCDTSFISLRLVLPAALALTRPAAWLVALIKPQFEAGKADVGKGGVVRDPVVHTRVCQEIHDWLAGITGWTVLGIIPSPITGPAGNKEFLIAARHQSGLPPSN
jgi:23S rRNA (cytidine1920-2'-O)/16S rRNA (cytidine1409-2'-O)-methyltransferase